MGLLEELPSSEKFTDILSGITGDEAEGTGIAGALKSLNDIEAAGISSSFVSGLNETLAPALKLDATALTADALDRFKRVTDLLPSFELKVSDTDMLLTIHSTTPSAVLRAEG